MTGNADVLEGPWKFIGEMICGCVYVTPVREAAGVLHTSVFTGHRFAQAEMCMLRDGEHALSSL